MDSFHRYLLSRYDIHTYEDYVHLLALFRNTRAIEAHNARQRYSDISAACASVEELRLSAIQRLKDHHSMP